MGIPVVRSIEVNVRTVTYEIHLDWEESRVFRNGYPELARDMRVDIIGKIQIVLRHKLLARYFNHTHHAVWLQHKPKPTYFLVPERIFFAPK